MFATTGKLKKFLVIAFTILNVWAVGGNALADRLKVKVRDFQGNEIENATVTASWLPGQQFRTDDDGEVKLRDTPRAFVQLRVSAPRFKSQLVRRDFTRDRESRLSVVLQPYKITSPPRFPPDRGASPPHRPGLIWVPGRYELVNGRYVWKNGHWESIKRPTHYPNYNTNGTLSISVVGIVAGVSKGEWMTASVTSPGQRVARRIGINSAGFGRLELRPGRYLLRVAKHGKWTGIVWQKSVWVEIHSRGTKRLTFDGRTGEQTVTTYRDRRKLNANQNDLFPVGP